MIFFECPDSFIKPCDFFYDINFSDMKSFSFIAFFENLATSSAYIIVDINFIVGAVTRNLLEKMDFTSDNIQKIDIKSALYGRHIKTIIP